MARVFFSPVANANCPLPIALPTFKKTPSNSTVHAGGTIRLDCAISGEPRAILAWLKDGGNDFPAARERRMHVMTEDYAFFITNAKVVDAGVYSCTAENVVGLVWTNATIEVLEAPMFLKPFEDKEVLPGTPTVLECMASGSPRPQLRWTKDGEAIDGSSERCYLAADDQLLVIMDSQARDAGTYVCEVWNELGTETGRMQLSVVAPGKAVVQAHFDSLSIIIIMAVGCVLGTSIIWLVIIYHTKKAAASTGSGARVLAAPNNSGVATMLTAVGDGSQGCVGNEYARTSLLANHSPMGSPVIVASGIVGPSRMLVGPHEGESLYVQQQQNNLGLLRNVSPVRLQSRDEQQRVRRQGGTTDNDSGHGDSGHSRNPTSSDDEEMDAMIEMQERQGSIQRNRLHEYLGEVCVGSVHPQQQTGMRGSTFKGSSGSVLVGGGEAASSSGNSSSLSNNSSHNHVAYGATATTT